MGYKTVRSILTIAEAAQMRPIRELPREVWPDAQRAEPQSRTRHSRTNSSTVLVSRSRRTVSKRTWGSPTSAAVRRTSAPPARRRMTRSASTSTSPKAARTNAHARRSRSRVRVPDGSSSSAIRWFDARSIPISCRIAKRPCQSAASRNLSVSKPTGYETWSRQRATGDLSRNLTSLAS
jgi:hypothetical protein